MRNGLDHRAQSDKEKLVAGDRQQKKKYRGSSPLVVMMRLPANASRRRRAKLLQAGPEGAAAAVE